MSLHTEIGVPATSCVFGYMPGTSDELAYRRWYIDRYHTPQDDLSQPWVPEAAASSTSSVPGSSPRWPTPTLRRSGSRKARSRRPGVDGDGATRMEVDLHGLTVAEALERAERALNDALLADEPQLRLIHGRSGGRIRAALHQWLRKAPSVHKFRLDPRNEGVTIVSL